MTSKQVNILGTNYSITLATESEVLAFSECDGYCDETTKECFIKQYEPSDRLDKGNFDVQIKKNYRHEIIHAFLSESGLAENSTWATNEEMVDWFAKQFPKIAIAFKEIDCI